MAKVKYPYKFRLLGKKILDLAPEPVTSYAIAKRTGISIKTAHRYFSFKSSDLAEVQLDVFATAMLKGLRVTPEEFMELKMSDIFTLEVKGN